MTTETTRREWETITAAREALRPLLDDGDAHTHAACIILGCALMARCPHDPETWRRTIEPDVIVGSTWRDVKVHCPACRAHGFIRERKPEPQS